MKIVEELLYLELRFSSQWAFHNIESEQKRLLNEIRFSFQRYPVQRT